MRYNVTTWSTAFATPGEDIGRGRYAVEAPEVENALELVFAKTNAPYNIKAVEDLTSTTSRSRTYSLSVGDMVCICPMGDTQKEYYLVSRVGFEKITWEELDGHIRKIREIQGDEEMRKYIWDNLGCGRVNAFGMS